MENAKKLIRVNVIDVHFDDPSFGKNVSGMVDVEEVGEARKRARNCYALSFCACNEPGVIDKEVYETMNRRRRIAVL